jgi:hypothetical protein
MMNILEITLSDILLKIWFRIEMKFKSDFETKDILVYLGVGCHSCTLCKG